MDQKHFEIFTKYFQTVATILLTTILLIAVLEGFSFLGITAYHYVSTPEQDVSDPRVNNEVYDNCSWADEYFKEFGQCGRQDIPYIGWSRVEYSGKYIHIDENGLRYTWNSKSENSSNAPIKIYFFGGSTMWGTGARDNYTIPSLVSKYLFENNINAEVINYGETGFQNTQEIIFCILSKLKGNLKIIYRIIDDAIIFDRCCKHTKVLLCPNFN